MSTSHLAILPIMHYSFHIKLKSEREFVRYWSSKYSYSAEEKYTVNIGKPLTSASLRILFEWKNGSAISTKKVSSICANYPLVFIGDIPDRYLNHKQAGGAIWNIFYLHCLDPKRWPIFDQHAFRAMRYLRTAQTQEIGSSKKQVYSVYVNEYIPFLSLFEERDSRRLDKALFAFGRFLKLAKRYG